MSFARPSLPVLLARIQAQLQANLPATTPQLNRSITQIVAQVVGMELYQEYAYLDNFPTWFFLSTAPGIYLDRRGNELGVPRIQGGYAQLNVAITGVMGYPLPAGSVVQTQDGSLKFTLNAGVSLGTGATNGVFTADQIGVASNLAAGVTLTLSIATAGINANMTVSSVAVAGTDTEKDTAYRARLLARLQNPPQGGAGPDYIAWAKLTPGVTRAFVYPLAYSGTAAGQVTVCPVYDARGSIIPLSADLTAVAAVITPLLPVGGIQLNVLALTADFIAVTTSGLAAQPGYTLAQVQANVTASLAALFASTTAGGAKFGDGIPWGTTGGFLGLDDIYNAIKQSAGVAEFDLTAPTGDITSASGHIAQLGTVTLG